MAERYKPLFRNDQYMDLFESEYFYEMSNFFPKDTGLAYKIWVTTKSGREKHWARIKVFDNDGMLSLTISKTPIVKEISGDPKIKKSEVNKIKFWIIKNFDVLLSYWKGEISSKQLSNSIKKLTKKEK